MYEELNPVDLDKVVMSLPSGVRSVLKKFSGLFLCGGYIQSIISNTTPGDIDIYATDHNVLFKAAGVISNDRRYASSIGENARTYDPESGSPPIQLITAKYFPAPDKVLETFDFEVCRAAVWWGFSDENGPEVRRPRWNSQCSSVFYRDLASKRLSYTRADGWGNGASALARVLKYAAKGFTIEPDDLSLVVAKMLAGKYKAHPEDAVHSVNIDEDTIAGRAFKMLKSVGGYDREGIIAGDEGDETLAAGIAAVARDIDAQTDATLVGFRDAVATMGEVVEVVRAGREDVGDWRAFLHNPNEAGTVERPPAADLPILWRVTNNLATPPTVAARVVENEIEF